MSKPTNRKRKCCNQQNPRKQSKTPSKKQTTPNLTILIDLPNSKAARTIQESIEPETKAWKGFRSRTTVSAQGETLKIKIVARDIVALRAASNSFLHFVAVGLMGVSAVAHFYRGRRTLSSRRRVP